MENEMLSKYLAGECTDQEKHELENWLATSSGNRDAFEKVKTLWEATTQSNPIVTDTEAQWQQLHATLQPTQNKQLIWMRYAAALLPIGLLLGYFFLQNEAKPTVQLVTNQTTKPMELPLPDGSVAWLRQGASVRFPENFEPASRQVELEGEAYFSVTSDAARPFTVRLGEVEVKVLGTEFNLKESEMGDFEVAVFEGKVAFYEKEKAEERQIILPNEKGKLASGSEKIEKQTFKNTNDIAWKTGVLSFQNTSLTEIAIYLESYYNTPFQLVDSVRTCTITTTFDNISLEEAVKIVELSLGIEAEINVQKVILSGSCQ